MSPTIIERAKNWLKSVQILIKNGSKVVKCGKKGGKNWWKSGKIDESGSNSGKTYG